MVDIGRSPELSSLDKAWYALEQEYRDSGSERSQGLQDTLLAYQVEAVRYRLAATDRVAELRRQLEGAYYKHIRGHWFSELNADELIQILPTLVERTLHWDGNGNGRVMWLAYNCLDTLPRNQAREIYLSAFTAYLRSFHVDLSVAVEQRLEIARTSMCLDNQQIYYSVTAQENGEALRSIICVELGGEILPVYEYGMEETRSIRED